MKIEQIRALDIVTVGEVEEGVEANISQESMPFMFEMMSKMLYSDRFGSIVREITSNCFDAHIEAGVEDAVIVSKTYEPDEGYFIEFKDVGVGMSPQRLIHTYMNYWTSTKRQSNDQHGGFGLTRN